jgi:hypothetical protein
MVVDDYPCVVAKGRPIDRPTSRQRFAFGSMPILSLTASRSFCLHPRCRSAVWMETCPSRKLNLVQFAPGEVAQSRA